MASLPAFEPPAMLEGLVCSLAVASAAGLLGLDAGAAAPAALLGVLFAVFKTLDAKIARNSVSALCGGIGSIAAFIDLDRAATCAQANVPLTLAWGGLLLVIAIFAGLHGFLIRRTNALVAPLSLFGALETLAFFVLPFGISLDQTSSPLIALIASLLAAVVLGALVGYAPDFGLFVFAILIGMAMLGVSATLGTACQAGPDYWGYGAALTYLVLYGLARLAIRRFIRV